MTLKERSRWMESRFYTAIRDSAAAEVADLPPSESALGETFDGHSYCLLVSYRRNGEAIATPVWFALDGDRLVFESDADSLKLKRIGRDPRVRIAPCSSRGRPLGAPLEATARIVDDEEAAEAERALDDKYGRMRRSMARLRPSPDAGRSYVEVSRE